jgi:hypothetical protein
MCEFYRLKKASQQTNLNYFIDVNKEMDFTLLSNTQMNNQKN